MQKKILQKLLIVILLLPIFIWLIALGKCEILTWLHDKEFETIYKENTMIGEQIDNLKVLDYSEQQARVYYVTKNKSTGEILRFVKRNNVWHYDSWEKTVWSAVGGSASGVVWPYWWHFIYGGF